ncbi:FRRS1-like protein [Mya arenaria]|uniref:FRRS1-like protein n=1 Tax=Mya arenaria TaxID=6604 RepID=A0ABY7E181_MYAAR|nr:FRRS1-like protein [Mya arenaria]
MLVLLSLLLLQAHKAEGFASGPPSYVCDSMSPNHRQAAQTGISPYQINFSKNTYTPNEQIQVTLSGSATFRGFMIQPRLQNSASTSTYGTITPDDAVNTNNPCSEKAALAHKNKIIFRTPVSFVWTAPSFDVGNIVFLYTVVEVMETFWVKNESPPLTYEAPTQAPTTQKPTTQAPTTPELTTQAPATQESTQQPQTSQKHKTQASTTQEPTTQAPVTQDTTTQAPVTQDTTTLAPTTQKPTTLDQITQELTTQAPTTQEPTTQAQTTQKLTTQALTTQKPSTHAPTTQEPTTQAQTTQKLTTQAPTTQKLTTHASTTQKPATQAPTTLKPTTPAPTSREPTSHASTTQKPATQAPTTLKPTTPAPTSREPTTQASTTQEPTTQTPTTQKPATQAPTTKEPATHATTTQKAATHAPTTATMVPINRDPNCDVTLNCFPSSTECSTNCDYLVTWRNVSDTEVEFSLKRKTTDTNYFIAIGFSKDRQMGDDSVVQCVSTDCVVGVRSSYNGAYKSNDLLDEKTFGVSLVSGSYSGGVLSCTFNRTNDADLLSVGSGRRRRAATYASSFFNLNKEYFLLVAHGEANKGYIRPHSETPKISSTKIDFLAEPDVNNQEKTTAVTINTGNITRDEGCGKNLGCFHDGCEGGKCDFLLTWKDDGNDVELSLSCKMSNNGYCAIGLSSDDKMPQYGLSSISTSANEGVITCSFRRQKVAPSRRKRASSGSNTFFDMNSDWTLLFAHGSAAAGYPLRHDTAPLVSSQVADFQRFQEIEADSVSRLLIKLHGILMVLAWMLLASIGITMARFYKEVWPEGMEWFQRKRWFVIHRACMVCVFVLTAVSFVIIFIHVGGFAQISGTYFEKSHPIIGIVVMALTVINPIMALFRPHPDTPKRKIFNYAHFGVGSGAHILSVINIFSGAMLASDFLTATAEIVVWIFVAWMIIFYLQQQLYECFLKKKKNVEMKTYDEIMKRSPQKKRDSFKIGFLIVHVFVVVGLGLAVVVMIAVG